MATAAPKKSSSKAGVTIILIIVAVVGVLWFATAANDDLPATSRPATATAAPRNHIVTYEVTCSSGKMAMTYTNSYGDTEQVDATDEVWKTAILAYPGDSLYVSAQNGHDHGEITCRILVDGKEVRRSKSSGAYVIATCSGTL